MLKNPADLAVKTKVGDMLRRLAADPANGIVRVLGETDLAKLGGFPGASFLLQMKDGTVLGDNLIGNVVTEFPSVRGMHGELPSNPGMNSCFFIAGKGIQASHNLGQIDMRQIAPTVAQALDVKLKDANLPVLAVFAASATR